MHFGNFRTALAAYLLAKQSNRDFLIRVEDVDTQRSRPDYATEILQDLRALGISSDVPVVYQSQRHRIYEEALRKLVEYGLVYECYCSRADIVAAASAPHGGGSGVYSGACRDLSRAQREVRRAELAVLGRKPALRLRAPENQERTVGDVMLGKLTGVLHDVVLRRSDGDWAYQLVVVVDDLEQKVDQVVRGADLASSAPVQSWLFEILGGVIPEYVHVPLVMNERGNRLAKRDKSVTRSELLAVGWSDQDLLLSVLGSLGWGQAGDPALKTVSVSDILRQAMGSWCVRDMPAQPVVFHV